MSEAATPKLSLFRPSNLIAAVIVIVGAGIVLYRFVYGLGASTNLDHRNPWGIWIGFDVVTGVALAAGGYVISSAVYLFGMKEYQPIVRPALLTGFIGYALVVVGLIVDLGRPWRLPYPFALSPGYTSPLFEVALCVALYLTVLLIESTPAAFEWLGLKRLRKIVGSLTIALTVFGVVLSTMHQSTLGTLYLITPTKLHPLWYSPHLPIHFFVSSIVAGISMVVVESSLSHRVFSHHEIDLEHEQSDRLTVGLGKAGAVALMVYLALKVAHLVHGDHWHLLTTPMGHWYLVELLGFVALPCLLYAIGFRERKPKVIQIAGIIAVVGLVLNRFNVSMIAFNIHLPPEQRYRPHWMEIWVSVTLVTVGVLVFRWIVRHMPVMHEHPDWKGVH